MEKSDVKHFKQFMQANQGRQDMTPEKVDLLIKQLEQRIADPRFAKKHEVYAAELERLQAVKRIMDFDDDEGED